MKWLSEKLEANPPSSQTLGLNHSTPGAGKTSNSARMEGNRPIVGSFFLEGVFQYFHEKI